MIRATVCQLPLESKDEREASWNALRAHAKLNKSDLLLLPEMPFHDWLCSEKEVDKAKWTESVKAHQASVSESGILKTLGYPVIVGTVATERDGKCFNEGFVWKDGKLTVFHTKHYLPNEKGYWEATWYDMSPVKKFETVDVEVGGNNIKIGMQICTDMWFFENARKMGKEGMDILFVPRATPHGSLERWVAGGKCAAITSGAFCLSSNRFCDSGCPDLGGLGWASSPNGKMIAQTNITSYIKTVDLNLKEAKDAKSTYPRYVIE